MHTILHPAAWRPGLVFAAVSTVFVLGGCAGVDPVVGTPSPYSEGAIKPIPPASPGRPSPPGLDDYKTEVARHVLKHNPDRSYEGTLPPLLPAIVVLQITVDRDGRLDKVEVQRSRDAEASAVALAALRRSVPLPRPQQLALAGGKLTFSETFLFADHERYQLRSLAGPQASE